MKKLVLFVAVITAVSFASCTNKAKEAAAPEAEAPAVVEETVTVVEEVVNDSTAVLEVTETETPAAE